MAGVLRKEAGQGLEPVARGLASSRRSMDLTLQWVAAQQGSQVQGESGRSVRGIASCRENWSDPRGGDT